MKKKTINELKKDFLRAYETLEEVKGRSEANSILNNFIPPFEILYGSLNNQGDQSVYVWTPDDKTGVTFDEYLTKVHTEMVKPSDDQPTLQYTGNDTDSDRCYQCIAFRQAAAPGY